MDNTIVYIKCKTGAEPLNKAYDSFTEKKEKYYNLDDQDLICLNDIDKDEKHLLFLLSIVVQ